MCIRDRQVFSTLFFRRYGSLVTIKPRVPLVLWLHIAGLLMYYMSSEFFIRIRTNISINWIVRIFAVLDDRRQLIYSLVSRTLPLVIDQQGCYKDIGWTAGGLLQSACSSFKSLCFSGGQRKRWICDVQRDMFLMQRNTAKKEAWRPRCAAHRLVYDSEFFLETFMHVYVRTTYDQIHSAIK